MGFGRCTDLTKRGKKTKLFSPLIESQFTTNLKWENKVRGKNKTIWTVSESDILAHFGTIRTTL